MTQTFSARVMALRPCSWRREWDGDDSDLGAYVHADSEDEKDHLPWESLYGQDAIDEAAAIAAEADALAEAARGLRAIVQRYRSETPLGHQPHMIASEADAALAAFDKAAGGAA